MANSAWSVAAPFKGVMKQIESVEVGVAGATLIEFSDIPQEYDALVLQIIGRTDGASEFDFVNIRFNDDSGNNYDYEIMYSQGDGVMTSSGVRATSSILMNFIEDGSSRASAFGSVLASILEYANTNVEKRVVSPAGQAFGNLSADTDLFHGSGSGGWRSSSAITKITLLSSGANDFVQYTKAILYGIKEDPGGMNGPGSSTDNAYPRWDGTNGRKFQDSLSSEDDAGIVTLSKQSGVSVSMSADQDIPSGSITTVQFDTEEAGAGSDEQNEFNTGTYTFTADSDGVYEVHINLVSNETLTDQKFIAAYVNKNAAIYTYRRCYMAATDNVECGLSVRIPLAANDTVIAQVYHNHGSNRELLGASCRFGIQKVA
jgi:hypothetical protein